MCGCTCDFVEEGDAHKKSTEKGKAAGDEKIPNHDIQAEMARC